VLLIVPPRRHTITATIAGAGRGRHLAQFLRRVTRKHHFASFRDMSHLLKAVSSAGAAFALVALITGAMPPLSPHWRAADLHQATPQARPAAFSLLRGGKG
jgi:hypothetical protein